MPFVKGKSGNHQGRPKGTPNKTTAVLKDALLEAATLAGGDKGMVGYLENQARANPQSFLPLLGKVLPMQLQGDPNSPLTVIQKIEREIVGPHLKNSNR